MNQTESSQQVGLEKVYRIIPKFKCKSCGFEVEPNIRPNGKMNCKYCRSKVRVRNRERNCTHFHSCPKCHSNLAYSEKKEYR